MYGLDPHMVMEADSAIMRSIAWANIHAIETWQSEGVACENMDWESMENIQKCAELSGVADMDTFIDFFKPDVIIQMFKNNNCPESFELVKKAEFVGEWGENRFLKEYKYKDKDTIILHCWHPSYLQKNIGRGLFASAIRDALNSHHEFKVLGAMKFYDNVADCSLFINLAQKISEDYSDLDNQNIAQLIIAAIAHELRKQMAVMSAVCLVSILNEVEKFKKEKWLYSTLGRGPCSVVRGAYNAAEYREDSKAAEQIALSFTKLNGEIAWS